MSVELYQRVALRRDLPEHRLKSGDIATLVDLVAHPNGGPQGCVLEVFNALGESIMTIAVSTDDVEPLQADEILSARHLAPVA